LKRKGDTVKEIPLTQGKVALVDDEDFERVNRFKWCATKSKYSHYARRTLKSISMHRMIISAPSGFDVDHINGNGLDNRRENLRICTRSQNQWNMNNVRKGSSNYKGVSWNKCALKWAAIIQKNYKTYFLGYFESEIEAAENYDAKARELFGPFAKTNFPMPQTKEIDDK
jgi:hypothetical protein